MNPKNFYAILVISVVALGTVAYFTVQNYNGNQKTLVSNEQEKTTMQQRTQIAQDTTQDREKMEALENNIDTITNELGVEKATLAPPSGGDASAIAYRFVKDGKYYHAVVAKKMPTDSQMGNYEAWLVNPQTSKYVSMGKLQKMEQQGQQIWAVTHSGENNDMGYNEVVVTKGTMMMSGNQPQNIVLQGQF